MPARGGSKRIPRKNLRPFSGVPLIARTVGSLVDTGLFDSIVVSTDDPEIAAIAVEAGAQAPFLRSGELSGDHTPTGPVVLDAIERFQRHAGIDVGEVCIAYPAAVCSGSDDYKAARELLHSSGVDTVFCAAAYPAPILRSWRQVADGRAEMIWPEHALTRSQDLEPAFHDTGQFYWWAEGVWQRKAAGEPVSTAMYLMERWRVQDIDDEEDWKAAEVTFEVLQRMRGSGPDQ